MGLGIPPLTINYAGVQPSETHNVSREIGRVVVHIFITSIIIIVYSFNHDIYFLVIIMIINPLLLLIIIIINVVIISIIIDNIIT